MISYGSCLEDVLLWRALAPRVHHDVGFWIDVGAYDPVEASVTNEFYQHGWRGINIEPLERPFKRLVELRPRDINIQTVVSDNHGERVTFYEIEGEQCSTTDPNFAAMHEADGWPNHSSTFTTTTLARICEQHAPGQIHFLKIDVEGAERAVLQGMDFNRWRPWILVIEATVPNRMDQPTHQEWEHLVSAAGYRFVHTALPNRYYVALEHPELMPFFAFPIDDYRRAHDVRQIENLNRENEELRSEIARLRGERSS